MYTTDMYEGMIAETININGHNNDQINAYFARPINSKAVPGIVLIHHLPGWDEWYRETTRKFAHHGFAAISPNLYFRDGHGEPDDIAWGVVYLASNESKFMTGSEFVVDGGITAM